MLGGGARRFSIPWFGVGADRALGGGVDVRDGALLVGGASDLLLLRTAKGISDLLVDDRARSIVGGRCAAVARPILVVELVALIQRLG